VGGAECLLVWLSVYANHPLSVTEPEITWTPGGRQAPRHWSCLYSQSPQACTPIHRAPTWLTTALMEWNALHTILALGVCQELCRSQCPRWV